MRGPARNFRPCARHAYEYQKLIELEISNCGDGARYRITYYHTTGEKAYYGQWQEIRYTKRGRAYIKDWHNYLSTKKCRRLYLDEFLQIN